MILLKKLAEGELVVTVLEGSLGITGYKQNSNSFKNHI